MTCYFHENSIIFLIKGRKSTVGHDSREGPYPGYEPEGNVSSFPRTLRTQSSCWALPGDNSLWLFLQALFEGPSGRWPSHRADSQQNCWPSGAPGEHRSPAHSSLQASGSTPMVAHMSWNCTRNSGFLRISCLCLLANSSRLLLNMSNCFDICKVGQREVRGSLIK